MVHLEFSSVIFSLKFVVLFGVSVLTVSSDVSCVLVLILFAKTFFKTFLALT